jgi:hypothetical protein
MSHCLRDRTLWLLSEGEASGEDRAHVASCVVCATRLHRLEQDLSQLRVVLFDSPPPQATLVRRRPLGGRWLASAAALAAMVVLAWYGVRWQRPSLPLPMEARQESIWPFIEGVSAVLFPTVDAGAISAPDQLADLDDLRAALAGDWPCDGQAGLIAGVCDNDMSALLGGQ